MQRARARHNTFGGLGRPWQMAWSPGTSLAGLFNLYPTLGNVTMSSDLATTLDGPMQVFRYGALTINTARTATNRCRGVVVLCDSLTMGAAGAFSMTGKGAAGSPKWAMQDILVPTSAVFTGQKTDSAAMAAYLAATGYFICDPTLWACPPPGMGDVVADYASWPGRGTSIISAAGRGGPLGNVITGHVGTDTYYAGATGSAGSSAPGGGGRGGYFIPYMGAGGAGKSGQGTVWGGGPGSGSTSSGSNLGTNLISDAAEQYGGLGSYGVAGTGGGPGGGVLLIICRGNVSIASGAVLTAAGTASATAGGAGGGFVGLFYSGSYSNSGTISAPGGTGNGAGGSGDTAIKTFATMGW